jgi:hypothetical protein
MTAQLELGNYSKNTRDTYLRIAKTFIKYYRRPAEELGEHEVRTYLLNRLEKVEPATVALDLAALELLYEVVLDRPEVVARIRRWTENLRGLLAPSHATTTLEPAGEQLEGAARPSAPNDTAERRQDIDDQSPCRPRDREDSGEAALAELTWQELLALLTGYDVRRCPRCGTPTRRVALTLAEGSQKPEGLDTS